jgi:hypothetical protein
MRTAGTSATRGTAADVDRTGPVGRLARVGLAVFLTLSLISIVDEGGASGFREIDVGSEPGLWILGALTPTLFVLLVGELARGWKGTSAVRRARLGALLTLAAAVALGAAITLVSSGEAWGFPLADLVWGFFVLMLVQVIVALLLAVIIGTPGCELGVWPELIWGVRGAGSGNFPWLACIIGIHFVDRWEAAQRSGPPTDLDLRQQTRAARAVSSICPDDHRASSLPDVALHAGEDADWLPTLPEPASAPRGSGGTRLSS